MHYPLPNEKTPIDIVYPWCLCFCLTTGCHFTGPVALRHSLLTALPVFSYTILLSCRFFAKSFFIISCALRFCNIFYAGNGRILRVFRGRGKEDTPAGAGKSRRRCQRPCRTTDYPRICEEKANTHVRRPDRQGSPPLTRGKVYCESIEPVRVRITPAYAGKSRPADLVLALGQDHPRLRGEKFVSCSL